jgi:hypothetical protein
MAGGRLSARIQHAFRRSAAFGFPGWHRRGRCGRGSRSWAPGDRISARCSWQPSLELVTDLNGMQAKAYSRIGDRDGRRAAMARAETPLPASIPSRFPASVSTAVQDR